jgi:prepilin-type N-terminal cleavage/methylation domain-containing protein
MQVLDKQAFNAASVLRGLTSADPVGNDAPRTAPKARHPRPGFTVVELLVVVAIIVLLIGILLPSIWKMHEVGYKGKASALLGAIQTGLQQYYNDFNIYPPSSGGSRGSVMLGLGLMGPGGDPAFGFRTRVANAAMGGGGRVYGPYAQPDPDSFKASGRYFVDPWGHEVLYYRSTQIPAPTSIFATGGTNAYFNASDCSAVSGAGSPMTGTAQFFALISGGNANTPISGAVTGATGFLLISAGPDEKYFTGDDIVAGK